ncbi:MAG: D-alanyl-D-alanine carboxypeptidase family protein [Pseudomonadota bacterium]
MKKLSFFSVISILVFGGVVLTNALAQNTAASVVPSAPDINAAAYVLVDVNSGKVLAQKNADQSRQPASLTKLMTLYLTFQAIQNGSIQLDSKVRISEKAWKTGGSKMFVKVGTEVTVEDLIKGVIVDSGNDAAVALAQYVGGSVDSFVSLMNQQAKKLGMTQTHFSDPTGLPAPDHVSTAHDLSLLARAIIVNFPQEYKYFNIKWFTYSNIRQPNRNRLLWRYPGADGLKTGHTKEAGYCLIASAKKENTRLLSVVLGAATDEERSGDSIALLRYGFRFYQSQKLYDAGQAVDNVRVWYGHDKYLPVGSPNAIYVTLPRTQFKNAKITTTLDNNLKAPIDKGQTIGTMTVSVGDQTIQSIPIVALQADSKGGVLSRFMDAIAYTFHRWFGDSKRQVTTTVTIEKFTQAANEKVASSTST